MEKIEHMEKKYRIVTYGCQMNVHESEKLAGILRARGYKEEAASEETGAVEAGSEAASLLESAPPQAARLRAIAATTPIESTFFRFITLSFPFLHISGTSQSIPPGL